MHRCQAAWVVWVAWTCKARASATNKSIGSSDEILRGASCASEKARRTLRAFFVAHAICFTLAFRMRAIVFGLEVMSHAARCSANARYHGSTLDRGKILMKSFALPCAAVLLVVAAQSTLADTTAEPSAPLYRIEEIPAPVLPVSCQSGYQTRLFPRRISDRLRVVGHASCNVSTGDPLQPVLDSQFGMAWSRDAGAFALPLRFPTSASGYARDVNNRGDIVGWELTDVAFASSRWNFNGGALGLLSESPCQQFLGNRAEAINHAGQIAAGVSVASPTAPSRCESRWLLIERSGLEVLGPTGGRPNAMNNLGVMVGSSSIGATKWSAAVGATALEPPAQRATAWELNDRGDVVGWMNELRDSSGCAQSADATVWSNDGIRRFLPKLPDLPVVNALGINDAGVVVGYASPGDADSCRPEYFGGVAIIWIHDQAYRLDSLIPSRLRIRLTNAPAINARGQIVASGYRLDEPYVRCPRFVEDPTTGEFVYDDTYMCPNLRGFVLSPRS
jgi:hypothetical protein